MASFSYIDDEEDKKKKFSYVEDAPSTGNEVWKATKGTAAAVGDLVGGLVKIPVQLAATLMAKAVSPSHNLDELWKASGESIEGKTPSFGSSMLDNQYYKGTLKPIELYSDLIEAAGNKAGELTNNKDVAGGVKMAASVLPIPGMHLLGKGIHKLAEYDPTVKSTYVKPGEVKLPEETKTAETPTQVGGWDSQLVPPIKEPLKWSYMDQGESPANAGERAMASMVDGIQPDPWKLRAEDLQRNDQTANRLQAALEKQNGPQTPKFVDEAGNVRGYEQDAQYQASRNGEQPMRVTPEGQAYTNSPEIEFARKQAEDKIAAIQQAIGEHTAGFKDLSSQLPQVQERLNELKFWKERAELLQREAINKEAPPTTLRAQVEDPFNPHPVSGTPEQMEGLSRSTENISRNEVPPDAVVPKDSLFLNGERDKPMLRTPKGNEWVKDENGIPVRKGLPESTVAPEYINKYMRQNEGARNDVGNAIQEANGPKLGQQDTYGTKNMGYGKGQSGALDIKGIKEGLDTLNQIFEKIGYGIPKTDLRDKALSELYGENLVTKPQNVADMLAKAQMEKDGPSLFAGLQSGLQMASEKMKSTVISQSAKWLTYSTRVGDAGIKNVVRPIERVMNSLNGKELTGLRNVFQEEMFSRERLSQEALLSRLNDKQLKVYNKMREAFELSYTLQNKAREAIGLESFTKQDAYMSSMFSGDWHVSVKNAEGRILWYAQNATRADATKAVKFLKDHFKNDATVDVNKIKYEFKASGNIPKDTMSAWKDIMDALPDGTDKDSLQAAYQAWLTKSGSKAFGQYRHQVDMKANVRGAMGDQAWLSEKANTVNWGKAQVRYLENVMRWTPKQEALNQIKGFLSDEKLNENQPNNMALLRAYTIDNMGISQNVMRGAENLVAEGLGRSSRVSSSMVGTLKGAFYAAKLWFSPGYWAATPMQALPASLSWFQVEKANGNVGTTSISSFFKSSLDAAASNAGVSGFVHSEFNKQALKWADNNQIISSALFDPESSLGGNKALSTLSSLGNASISIPDQWSRRQIFLPMANALWDGGKYATPEKAFQRAAEITDMAMVSMRREDRPLLVNKLGATGDALWTLKAPIANMYNHLGIFYGMAKQGNVVPLATYLGAMGMMGGVMALPFVSETDHLLDVIKEASADHLPQLYEHIKNMGIKENLIGLLPERNLLGQILGYGVGSASTGVNMATRFNNELVNPGEILQSVSPLAQEVTEWGSLGNIALHPNGDTVSQSAYQFAPGPMARGILENSVPNFKAPVQPYPSATGYLNPNNLIDKQPKVYRTPEEERARVLGVTALSESQRRDKDYAIQQKSMRDQAAINSSKKYLWQAIMNGNSKDVKTYAQTIYKLGGSLDGMIETEAQKLGMTPQQFAQIHANTVQKLLAVKDRMEMDK